MARNNAAMGLGLLLAAASLGACSSGHDVADDAAYTTATQASCFPLASTRAPDVSVLSEEIRQQLMDRTGSVRQSPTSDKISRWLLNDLAKHGRYEDKVWGALMLAHLPEAPPYHPVRIELVDAMHQTIVESLKAAASENGSETGAWADRLALDEAKLLPDELAAVYFYLRGRAANGKPLSSCPATLPADTGIEGALTSDNTADQQLAELAELLHIRRLNMPAEPWDEGPNEWNVSAKLVGTGGNSAAAVHDVAAKAMESIDWFFEIFGEPWYCGPGLDPLEPQTLDGSCSSETRLTSSWDPSLATSQLLDVMPSAELRQRAEALIDGLADNTFYFQGYDVGAELFGQTFIIIAPDDGTLTLVVQLEYSHS
jgi:hypothetical protein